MHHVLSPSPTEGNLGGGEEYCTQQHAVSGTGLRFKAVSILKLVFQTDLTSTCMCSSYNRDILSTFLLELAVPVNWFVQLEFVSSTWRQRVPDSNLSLCYRQVLPATFCKKIRPLVLYSSSDFNICFVLATQRCSSLNLLLHFANRYLRLSFEQ